MRILIADDDRELTWALAARCRECGLDAVEAHDGFTALALARYEKPDVFCLDVDMPGGNGLGVCEMLASDESFSKTPIIVLTGHRDANTIRRCHDLCAFYVPKGPNIWHRVEPLLAEIAAKVP